MAGSAICVEILEPGRRADELLGAVAETLGLRPNRKGNGIAYFWFSNVSAQDAWEATVDAVSVAGEDWADHISLSVPPDLDDRPYEPTAQPVCSFCGKPERLVEKLVAGPGIYICDECVVVCVQILDAERGDQIVPADG